MFWKGRGLLEPAAHSRSPFPYPAPPTTSGPWAEPHEICDEDNFGTVVWKETPAGEVAAVRCPRNATGEGWGAGGSGLLSHLTDRH